MRRIIILAAAGALSAAPAALAQDVRPGSPPVNDAAKTPDQPAAPGAPAAAQNASEKPGEAEATTADDGPKPPNPDPDAKGVPPPDAAAQKAALEKAQKEAEPPPKKMSKVEAGGTVVGGLVGTAAGNAVGGPLGGAAAGFVGNKLGGGIGRVVKKVFGGGKKKDAPAQQQAEAAPAAGADASSNEPR